MVETILTIKEAMRYCDNVGCVYPTDEESYYINSNGNSWLFCEMDCNKRHWFIV